MAITPFHDEKLIDAFSTHWIKYVMPVVLFLLLGGSAVLFFFFSGMSSHHSMWLSHGTYLVALLLFSIAHHWFFHKILSEGMDDVIITNKRLIFLDAHLLFRDDMHEVSLDRIRALEARKRGFVQNILRYGSIWFDTGGSEIKSGRIIPLVPHPHSKVKLITDLLEMK
jgi:uncharacterized membrane protein YdbT with pleckstrin-like domain